MDSGQCANCGARVAAGSRQCEACGQAIAAPATEATRVVASAVEVAPAAPPVAAKSGCGLWAWLTTGIGCGLAIMAAVVLLVVAAVAIPYFVKRQQNTAAPPVVPPPADAPVAGVVTPVAPDNVAPGAMIVTAADYVGTWFSVTGEPGEDNTIVIRMEGKQLVCVSAGGANRMTFSLRPDGSIYGIARGEGMTVPVHGQLTADKRQLNLTALYEASEPSLAVFQRGPII